MSNPFGHHLPTRKVAFVAGANGISGGAIIDHLVKQSHREWSEIITTSRRPIKSIYTDPRVRFVALDFLEPAEEIVDKIKELCKDVTHAFFTSYVHDNDFSKLHVKNGPLFRNFLESVDLACPRLQRVVLQTGGKHYGFQFRDIKTPLVENMPRYEGPENIFYYEQEDDLFAIQKRRSTWNYNIIRPMGIIGYSWQYLGINETLPIAQYFLICRELGEAPQWPGNLDSYHRVENQSYAPSIADLTVWAATQDQCRDEVFNHCNGDVIVWKFLWHLLADYFKVPMDKFEAPTEQTKSMNMGEWAKDKKPIWERIVAKYGGEIEAFQLGEFELMNWLITPSPQKIPFISTVAKAREFGWNRSDDTYQTWLDTLRSYENAGVLPIL
ncbi:hypothetical protein N7447_007022 [Penicillium robsamsonii]|uniref:uncharacterized protein n=1 Tax=Penicillium robsamsonii TaxID=1792511 RepID=UPI00254910CC|nr:uncharacterized protein N7447_007022 [Penicillium robsamsonii]KAJ5824682.1 hypothetical protein N7447_007022 [Penicillium robsamsonii]